ncbi:hypothetical protein D3C74_253710 [compost metagenome]
MRFDLTQLDTEAADFHLIIDPAHILNGAVRQPSGQVTRSIHPLIWCKRVNRELLLCQLWTVQVASGQSVTSYAQFPGDSNRLQLVLCVHDVDRRIADRSSDRNRDYILLHFVHIVARCKYRTLRRSIHMLDFARSKMLKCFAHMVDGDTFSTEQHSANVAQAIGVHVYEHIEKCGCNKHH